MRLWLARHPARLTAERPILIQQFLQLVADGKPGAVAAMITMLQDLLEHGRDCRYLQKLK